MGQPDDLDALIGEIRHESARRRAAPDFPLEEEARLTAEMDRQGSSGRVAQLDQVIAGLRALADSLPVLRSATPADRPRRGAGRRRRDEPAGTEAITPGQLAELIGLTVAGLRTLATRAEDFERRAGRLLDRPALANSTRANPTQAKPTQDGTAGPDQPFLDHWASTVVQAVEGPGPVLVGGAGARPWVDLLSSRRLDAYGTDPSLPRFGDQGAVRAGSLVEHLDTVGEGALGGVVVTGPLDAGEIGELDGLAASLARVAASAVVVSETPWWWARRTGPEASDTSPRRPVSAETWLAVLDRAGFRPSGQYGPGGRDYCVTAGRALGSPSGAP